MAKHFPKGPSLNKIFNRNSVKVSYSCMQNMATIIKQHITTILRPKEQANGGVNDTRTCNCRAKDACPLDGACLTESIVYKARVTAGLWLKKWSRILGIARHKVCMVLPISLLRAESATFSSIISQCLLVSPSCLQCVYSLAPLVYTVKPVTNGQSNTVRGPEKAVFSGRWSLVKRLHQTIIMHK